MTGRRVLILCTGNSARSQMAEGLLRELGRGQIEVFSAGTKPSAVNPFAIRAMTERGIDIGGQRSKHLDEFRAEPFDTVITVCDDAAEACPVFPGRAERIHWSIPDPAAFQGSEAEQLAAFRAARDQLDIHLRAWRLHEPGALLRSGARLRSLARLVGLLAGADHRGKPGLNTSTGMVVYNSQMQVAIPDRMKGRVFTLMDMAWSVMEIASIGLAGLLVDVLGIQPVYYLGGGLLIVAGLAGLMLLSRYRSNATAQTL